MLKIDNDLFCEMAKFYGDSFHIPPLAAKIYAYLIFDFERNGVAFDEFVEVFAASKSSVSSNLNLLLNLHIIGDFNKIDERKRFFVMNEQYMNIRFEEIILKMERELSILSKLKEFRNPSDAVVLNKFEIYKNMLEKNIFHIKESLNQL